MHRATDSPSSTCGSSPRGARAAGLSRVTSPNTRVIAPALLALAVLASATAATAVRSDEPPVSLVSGVQSLRIAAGSGAELELPLDAGVRIRKVAAAEGGCIAAGVRNESALLLIHADLLGGASSPSGLSWGEPERLVTPTPGGTYVSEPTPLVENGDLEGMVWLSGDGPRTTNVLYAEFLGDHWGPTEVVSPAGEGSQIALAATALGDGSFLALWSAYDGSDDEIVWSRFENRSWSAPRPIAADNWVPDITPAVTVLGGRPVAVWSRYEDGGYRLVMSHLDGDTWSDPERFAAVGSLFPSFDPTSDGALLMYRDARSGVWKVLKLDENLRTTASASIETGGAVEPAVLDASPQGLDVVPGPDRPREMIPWAPVP